MPVSCQNYKYHAGEASVAHENADSGIKIVAVRQLGSRGMQGLAVDLARYGSNNNRLRVDEKEE